MKNTHLAACLLLAAVAVPAPAATWYVEAVNGADNFAGTQTQPFQTLSRAISAAASGDTILVENGQYVGKRNRDLDFAGKNLIVKSRNGPANCFLDGRFTGRLFNLHSGETPSTRIEGFTLRNGWATNGPGGLIWLRGSSVTVVNCVLATSHAFEGGGAIALQGNGSASISACSFTGNSSGNLVDAAENVTNGGGAVLAEGGVVSVANCAFTNNTAYQNGVRMAEGGAVNANGNSDVTLTDCTFSGNVAAWGEGVYSGHRIAIVRCTFTNHTGIVDLLLIKLPSGAASLQGQATVLDTVFAGNSAGLRGAVDGSQITVGNGLFHRNGVAILTAGADLNIVNTTFADNTDPQNSVLQVGEAAVAMANCIAWNPNTAPFRLVTDGTLTVRNSDVQGGIPAGVTDGGGNIAADPLFVNAAAGNYHLTATSPCRDAGNTAAVISSADLDGHPRVQGAAPDMGAYELTVSARRRAPQRLKPPAARR